KTARRQYVHLMAAVVTFQRYRPPCLITPEILPCNQATSAPHEIREAIRQLAIIKFAGTVSRNAGKAFSERRLVQHGLGAAASDEKPPATGIGGQIGTAFNHELAHAGSPGNTARSTAHRRRKHISPCHPAKSGMQQTPP